MYICVTRGGKDKKYQYVRLMENYRNEKGVTCGRIVKNFGRLDKMLENDPLALDKLKQQYAEKSAAEKKLKSDHQEEELAKILSEDGDEANSAAWPSLNYSYYIIRKVWNDFLNVNTRIDYLQKRYFGGMHDIKTVLLYLVTHKAVDPCSAVSPFHDKDSFLGDPAKNVSLEQMYQTYAFASEYKDQIFEAVYRSLDDRFGHGRTAFVFYDVLNASPASSPADAEQGEERMSVALATDAMGFPMDFAVCPGGAPAFRTMSESIDALKSTHGIDGAVVVAGRGLDSPENLQTLLDHGLGFIAAQDVTRFDASLTARMLDLSLYRPVNEDGPCSVLCQVVPDWKKPGMGTADGGGIACTLVLTFSESRREREAMLLDAWAEAVEQMRKKGGRAGSRRSGWASMAGSGNGDGQRIPGVGQELLETKRKLCGFAAMVFREPPCAPDAPRQAFSGAETVRLHHRLNEIGDCFRAMTGRLDFSPMCVSDEAHMHGHMAICTLSLLMLRIIQHMLETNAINMSINEICGTLGSACVTAFKSSNHDARFVLSDTQSNYRSGHEHASSDELVELLRQGGISRYRPNDILKACGLDPLPRSSTRHTLARCLGTRFHRDEDAIPEVRCRLLS